MALPNPTATWKLVRWLVREADVAIPLALAYLADSLDGNEQAGGLEWIRWNTIATRTTPTGTVEDKVQFKLDLLNITGGAVDVTWTSGDFAAVKALMDTFLTTVKARVTPNHTFTQYRAYRMSYNAADPGPGARSASNGWAFNASGAPVYVADFSTPATGSSTAYSAYQVAATVTLRTGWPKHWGRIYLPTPSVDQYDSNGRLVSAYRVAIANAAKALVSGLADAGFLVTVPVTDLEKQAFHALLGVNSLVVDDIPDIQRRRRPKQAAARTVGV